MESSLPLVGDDAVHVAIRPQVWRGRCYALLEEQQQGLMAALLHTGHDGDQGAQGKGGGFSQAREVSCRQKPQRLTQGERVSFPQRRNLR